MGMKDIKIHPYVAVAVKTLAIIAVVFLSLLLVSFVAIINGFIVP